MISIRLQKRIWPQCNVETGGSVTRGNRRNWVLMPVISAIAHVFFAMAISWHDNTHNFQILGFHAAKDYLDYLGKWQFPFVKVVFITSVNKKSCQCMFFIYFRAFRQKTSLNVGEIVIICTFSTYLWPKLFEHLIAKAYPS